jgi:LAO/AO transport system kinase
VDLVAQTLAGDRRALARLISRVEDNAPSARQALAALYAHTGQAHLIGVTGAPGTGKSTLVNQMAKALRAQERTVGVVAVDPTSPFSGGALLGDRVRMRDLSGDPGIFIRSMATRGSLGGLAQATDDVVKVLDAAGFDVVLIETVGAGQSEVEIARTAHSTVVIEAPGLGDDVQALKAGLLEIADVLVVNKSDRPEAARTVRALEATLALGRSNHPEDGWEPPILQTVALDGTGVPELLDAVAAHRSYLEQSGSWTHRERNRARTNLTRALERELIDQLTRRVGPDALERWVDRIVAREVDAYAAAHALIEGQDPR